MHTLFNMSVGLFLCVAVSPDGGGNRNDPWFGYGEGSWIILAKTVTSAGVSKVQREKRIVTRIREGTPELGVFKEVNGEYPETRNTTMHAQGVDVPLAPEIKKGEPAAAVLTIDSQSITCERRTYTLDNSKADTVVTVTIWECADVSIPYRELSTEGPDLAMGPHVLKIQYSLAKGMETETSTFEVKSLKEKLRVGGREIVCTLEEGDGGLKKGEMTAKGTWKRWLSNEVPGHVARMERHVELNGQAREMIDSVEEWHVVAVDHPGEGVNGIQPEAAVNGQSTGTPK